MWVIVWTLLKGLTIFNLDAVLITGGYDFDNLVSAELFLPSSGLSCSLPNLPDQRGTHTVDSLGLICGGDYDFIHNTTESCLKWRSDTGSWEKYLTLNIWRAYHASWTPSNGIGTYLMGGFYSNRTTTLIKPDGTQEPGFPLKYDIR